MIDQLTVLPNLDQASLPTLQKILDNLHNSGVGYVTYNTTAVTLVMVPIGKLAIADDGTSQMIFMRSGEDRLTTVPNKTYSDNTFAKKGANSDITSLSGLTTPLSVAQGGTGKTLVQYGTFGALPDNTPTTVNLASNFANTTYTLIPVVKGANWGQLRIVSQAVGSFVLQVNDSSAGVDGGNYVAFGTA